MIDLSFIYQALGRLIPCPCMEARFMQQALLGLLLLAPMAATMGVHVVNHRMAFFSDAVSHTAFTGVAIGLILGLNPDWTMVVFALVFGLGIMVVQRRSSLSVDTVIGVFFSAGIAFGLAVVSRDRSAAVEAQTFLYGDILTLDDPELTMLLLLFVFLFVFMWFGYNRLLYIGLHPALAQTHRVRVRLYQYVYAALLALVVIFSVRTVGMLLVTAMLVVPAAAARNFARSAGRMFWWANLIGVSSAVAGLLISAQNWANTATGATVILVACLWFVVSALVAWRRTRRQ